MGANRSKPERANLLALMRVMASGERAEALRMLDASAELVRARLTVGASRQAARDYFLTPISHYVYDGDTALHVAAAAFDAPLVRRLLELGADVGATNRRGAQPLHYASDANRVAPNAQAATIRCLCEAGAHANALDKSGVAPLHRAVRTRGAAAVEALLAAGADVRLKNKTGSTPLHLAVQNTGRGGSGEAAAVERQRAIILSLLGRGASLADRDGSKRTVVQAAQSDWIRAMLAERSSSR
jgi:ankyrin repeat protein